MTFCLQILIIDGSFFLNFSPHPTHPTYPTCEEQHVLAWKEEAFASVALAKEASGVLEYRKWIHFVSPFVPVVLRMPCRLVLQLAALRM
jgi:hypothetical protein